MSSAERRGSEPEIAGAPRVAREERRRDAPEHPRVAGLPELVPVRIEQQVRIGRGR